MSVKSYYYVFYEVPKKKNNVLHERHCSEKRTQFAQYVVTSGKSASIIVKELGIGIYMVCRWVKKYCMKKGLLNYEVERSTQRQFTERLQAKMKNLER